MGKAPAVVWLTGNDAPSKIALFLPISSVIRFSHRGAFFLWVLVIAEAQN